MMGTVWAAAGWSSSVSASSKIPVSPKPVNGAVASYQRLDPSDLTPGVQMYRVDYWSQNVKVEALLTEPVKSGHYPLLVSLHGGDMLPSLHWNFGYTPWMAGRLASPQVVQLYPEYQGYLGSSDMTGGIRTDFINIQDAMKIAYEFGDIQMNDTYVLGYSLGGGLALMTAAWDHQVRAVVAVSPFVGLTDAVEWARAHPKLGDPSLFPHQTQQITTIYGNNIHSLLFRQRSPNPQTIHAPVLLLQGTADPNIVWQTVALFAEQMRHDHRRVTLMLYPGGHHGLKGRHLSASTRAIRGWFKKYGLDFNFRGV